MRGTRRTAPLWLSLAGLLVTSAALAPASVHAMPAAPAASRSTSTLAPGLTLSEIVEPTGPNRVYVLTVDPSQAVSIDVATAGRAMGAYARPSSIGAAHGALAAINGDFTVDPGRPVHPLQEDGTLRQLGLQGGASFAISQDETHAYVADQKATVTGENLTTKAKFSVLDFNTGKPAGGDIVGYTSYGAKAERPPVDACSVRLKAAGKLHWGPLNVGVNRDWTVDRLRCGGKRMAVKPGTLVLSAGLTGGGAATIKHMTRGQIVRVTWSFGWAGVMDTVGGMPLLVDNGVAVAPANCNSYFCSRNPRTGIGLTADGKVLLVVVDGRSRQSAGMTLIGFARYMIGLGAVYALNLDGGGGSAMWIAGRGVISRPSDYSGERPVTNAVLVLPGADTEPVPLPYSKSHQGAARMFRAATASSGLTQLVSSLQARQAMDASLADPGSTGGLMGALAARGFGPQVLPAAFLRMARVYHARNR
jgi:Phosphodiester glycosidase